MAPARVCWSHAGIQGCNFADNGKPIMQNAEADSLRSNLNPNAKKLQVRPSIANFVQVGYTFRTRNKHLHLTLTNHFYFGMELLLAVYARVTPAPRVISLGMTRPDPFTELLSSQN